MAYQVNAAGKQQAAVDHAVGNDLNGQQKAIDATVANIGKQQAAVDKAIVTDVASQQKAVDTTVVNVGKVKTTTFLEAPHQIHSDAQVATRQLFVT